MGAMNWCDERYVRVYVRDTTSWLMWSWQARALWLMLLRKADRCGVIDLAGYGKQGVVALTGMPWDVASSALEELLADGCVEHHEDGDAKRGWLQVRNFVDAQEAQASDRQRQRESRLRRIEGARAAGASAAEAKAAARPDYYAARSAASGHERSRVVTPGHEELSTGTERDHAEAAIAQVVESTSSGHAWSRVVTAGHSVPSVPYRTVPPDARVRAKSKNGTNGPFSGIGPGGAASGSVSPAPDRCMRCGKKASAYMDGSERVCLKCYFPPAKATTEGGDS